MAENDESLPTLAKDLWQMVRDYAKQETLDPLKGILRFVGIGLLGAVLTSVGLVTLSVAGVRAIQAETGDRLTGGWSWVPYGGVLVAVVLTAVFSASRIGKKGK
jgi:hypothetical protein